MKYNKITSILLILFLFPICLETYGTEQTEPDAMNGMTILAAQEPNLYELRGWDIEVTYSTSSFSGQPLFTYRDRKRTLTFQGDEIQQLDSGIGHQVTVIIEQIPDLCTVTLTLLLPAINLKGTECHFQTKAIMTTHRTSIGGPDLVKGVLQTYRTKGLRGRARLVNF